jgi:hypothetical protein
MHFEYARSAAMPLDDGPDEDEEVDVVVDVPPATPGPFGLPPQPAAISATPSNADVIAVVRRRREDRCVPTPARRLSPLAIASSWAAAPVMSLLLSARWASSRSLYAGGAYSDLTRPVIPV